jgi:hypothetical protein
VPTSGPVDRARTCAAPRCDLQQALAGSSCPARRTLRGGLQATGGGSWLDRAAQAIRNERSFV